MHSSLGGMFSSDLAYAIEALGIALTRGSGQGRLLTGSHTTKFLAPVMDIDDQGSFWL